MQSVPFLVPEKAEDIFLPLFVCNNCEATLLSVQASQPQCAAGQVVGHNGSGTHTPNIAAAEREASKKRRPSGAHICGCQLSLTSAQEVPTKRRLRASEPVTQLQSADSPLDQGDSVWTPEASQVGPSIPNCPTSLLPTMVQSCLAWLHRTHIPEYVHACITSHVTQQNILPCVRTAVRPKPVRRSRSVRQARTRGLLAGRDSSLSLKGLDRPALHRPMRVLAERMQIRREKCLRPQTWKQVREHIHSRGILPLIEAETALS